MNLFEANSSHLPILQSWLVVTFHASWQTHGPLLWPPALLSAHPWPLLAVSLDLQVDFTSYWKQENLDLVEDYWNLIYQSENLFCSQHW